MPMETKLREDPIADRAIAFLQAEGADHRGHSGGRSLLEHLIGTYEILRRWEQPSWLQHAALIHSVYGTEAYRHQLIPPTRRREVSALVGEGAERLAHLFATTPRRLLFAGTQRWARSIASGRPTGEAPADAGEPAADEPATRGELDALVLVHLANLAEQARAPDGSPGTWIARLRDRAEVVFDSRAVDLPLFIATLAGFSADDESACRGAYRDGLASADRAVRGERLAMAAAACPVVGEPCVWLAAEARRRGELAAAREWAQAAQRRLRALGAAWDKRLAFDEWLALAGRLGEGHGLGLGEGGSATVADPRALYDEVLGAPAGPAMSGAPPEPLAATARFQRYMEMLADSTRPAGRLLYPGLDSRPWFEASTFALATALEAHFAEIREEVLALAPSRFVPESERIARTGDWDVVFFYERGSRHDDVCEACPATARAIEGADVMRTAAGLIYVSRMRPGTHIQAHRGPTNLRVRCHLGITVPDGDCALRVGDRSERWREGGCLVFDDSFEHEAWNRTAGDRIVLIVDLWHPGLSSTEVHLLAGLHRYAAGYSRRLEAYWSVNEAARRERPGAVRP
jgi:aspartyl/asparaginyl beta-hydroxylase/uncharacterized protein DUF6817